MKNSGPLVEIWRGDYLESQHIGHVVVCDDQGKVIASWGDSRAEILPRSSCKILQALPLVASGAADRAGLRSEHLALACASHQGAAIHTDRVLAWLKNLGKDNDDLRCGPQTPNDIPARNGLIKSDQDACRYHNNCSGKHCGFLTLSDHLGGDTEYHHIDHPVQKAVREAFEVTTNEVSSGYGIDGCSAPNFACTVSGLAHAMAFCATSNPDHSGLRGAAARLRNAMIEHPELVAGETRACTELMRATPGVALKTGAEAVYTAIIPSRGWGVAIKVQDGAFRASEAVIAGMLSAFGLLDPNHPAAQKRLGPIENWDGLVTGAVRLSDEFHQSLLKL